MNGPGATPAFFMGMRMETSPVNMLDAAAGLGPGWASRILADMPAARIKLFQVDPAGLAEEVHPTYPEALLMLAGAIRLRLGEQVLPLRAGDFQLIPAGVPHAIEPGGSGAFLLMAPE